MAYVLFRSLHLIAAVVFAGALIIKNLATGRLSVSEMPTIWPG